MDKQLVSESREVPGFSIPYYIIYNILPKCNCIFGTSFSSTYLQLISHINYGNNKNLRGKTWISIKSISQNTGFNTRTIKNHIISLQNLNLLIHDNIYYVPINHDICNGNIVRDFINLFDELLINHVESNSDKEYVKNCIDKINSEFQYQKLLTKNVWFPNINYTRNLISMSEGNYKGSSLLFLNLYALDLNQGYFTSLREVKPIHIGCSKSTFDRYIRSFRNVAISLDYKFQKGVLEKMENSTFICPICKIELKNARSFGIHIAKTKEYNHEILNELKKESGCSASEVENLFNDNLSRFNLDQLNIKESDQPKNKNIVREISLESVDSHKERTPNASEFVKYFYSKTGGRSHNWAKEAKQIKNLITRKDDPINKDEIIVILDYMVRRGYTDLRFLTNSINDALMEYKYRQEINIPGSPAFLVKKFYNGNGMKLNVQTFLQDVRKVIETINSGSSYEEVSKVIDYMIEKKCKVINFIASKRTEYLASNLGGLSSNPVFNDQGEDMYLIDELKGGRTKIQKLENNRQEIAKQYAYKIYTDHSFSKKYNHFEWAWYIGLEIDKDMYEIGLKTQRDESYFEFFLKERGNEMSEQAKKNLVNGISMYKKWVEEITIKFGTVIV